MPSSKNHILLAAAGSGKTTSFVAEALRDPSRRVLMVTYTVENVSQLEQYIVAEVGCVPPHVTVMSWYAFLLQHCVRPYQRSVFPAEARVRSIFFDRVPPGLAYLKKSQPQYYLTTNGLIYRDRLAAFAFEAQEASGGSVIARLERIYDLVVVDELQDMAGYDLDLVEALFASKIEIMCGGDLRQATYATNDHTRNKQYRGAKMINWVTRLEHADVVTLKKQSGSYRCNAKICDFANSIFPEMSESVSLSTATAEHEGIVFLKRKEVAEYLAKYAPQVLRYSRSTATGGLQAMNFGATKGRTYEHVLIFPTSKIRTFLKSGLPKDIGDREKFYVAVTRARHSVAIVID